MLFEREEFYMKKALKNHIIIFGHTPAFLIKAKLKQNINFAYLRNKIYGKITDIMIKFVLIVEFQFL